MSHDPFRRRTIWKQKLSFPNRGFWALRRLISSSLISLLFAAVNVMECMMSSPERTHSTCSHLVSTATKPQQFPPTHVARCVQWKAPSIPRKHRRIKKRCGGLHVSSGLRWTTIASSSVLSFLLSQTNESCFCLCDSQQLKLNVLRLKIQHLSPTASQHIKGSVCVTFFWLRLQTQKPGLGSQFYILMSFIFHFQPPQSIPAAKKQLKFPAWSKYIQNCATQVYDNDHWFIFRHT